MQLGLCESRRRYGYDRRYGNCDLRCEGRSKAHRGRMDRRVGAE